MFSSVHTILMGKEKNIYMSLAFTFEHFAIPFYFIYIVNIYILAIKIK